MAAITRPVSFLRRLAASTASAAVIAAAAAAATIFLFFVALLLGTNGADQTVIWSLGGFFLISTLVVFVVMTVMGLVGTYSRWYLVLLAALIAAFLGGMIGNIQRLIAAGTTVDGSSVFVPLLSSYFPYEVLVIVAALTAGVYLYRRIARDQYGPGEKRIVIVRAPAANLADGEVTHVKRTKVDATHADTQWDAYVAAFANQGWDIVEVPVGEGMPDSVFVEDAVVLFGDLAVIASPGADSRRGETAAVETSVRELGLKTERITLPGTLDGGDVLKVGTTVYVGRGGRTNADGIRQLRALIAPLGYSVVAVPMTKALHLKSAVTALPDGTVIGWPAVVDDPSLFDRFMAMPEEGGAHVVVLDHSTVLMAESAPKSAALLSDLGYLVVTVDISEFEKLEGCVTCLSVRLR
ncbi:MAG: dimethylarginine dimethylaminohydrolase [Microbacteriaceae bacterium]|nr:dimethylarginine dimethylaminohydrolase [Microbacteriaceae bacterium]